jgi:hypothetical protein
MFEIKGPVSVTDRSRVVTALLLDGAPVAEGSQYALQQGVHVVRILAQDEYSNAAVSAYSGAMRGCQQTLDLTMLPNFTSPDGLF